MKYKAFFVEVGAARSPVSEVWAVIAAPSGRAYLAVVFSVDLTVYFLPCHVQGELVVVALPPLSLAEPVTMPDALVLIESTPVPESHEGAAACTIAMSSRPAPLGALSFSSRITLTKSNPLPDAVSVRPTASVVPDEAPEPNRVEATQSSVGTTQSESTATCGVVSGALNVTDLLPTVPPPVSPVTNSSSPVSLPV